MSDDPEERLANLRAENHRLRDRIDIMFMTIFKLMIDNLEDGKVEEVKRDLINLHDHLKTKLVDR